MLVLLRTNTGVQIEDEKNTITVKTGLKEFIKIIMKWRKKYGTYLRWRFLIAPDSMETYLLDLSLTLYKMKNLNQFK